MLKKAEKYNILVVDSDVAFLERVTALLEHIVKDDEAVVLTGSEFRNVDTAIENRKTDIAFLDERAFINQGWLTTLYEVNPNCMMILMVSNYGGKNIREIIKTFKNHHQVFMGEYLLKDNYSDNVLKVFCRKYLDKMKCVREINNLNNE